MRGIKAFTLLQILTDYVSDPRADREKKFPLGEILFLVFSMIACGAKSISDIVQFGKNRVDWLRKYMPYTNGIPSETTLRRVLQVLMPEQVHEAFAMWMTGVAGSLEGCEIALDGKEMRGSEDEDGKKTHIVSAVLHIRRLVLAQVACDKKSNEITAIPELLDMLDLTGALVTIDAMGTQILIANQITEKKGFWLLPVKNNRKTDCKAIDARLEGCEKRHSQPDDVHYAVQEETNQHGRSTRWDCWLESVGEDFSGCRTFAGLQGVARVRTTRTANGKTTVEVHRFIFSKPELRACDVIDMKRGHWASVENGLHYALDVAFDEDASRVCTDHSAENFNAFRQMAYNVLRELPGVKGSFQKKQNECLLNQEIFDRAMGMALDIWPRVIEKPAGK